ncbi:MAG TPA: hypothetical protein VKH37_13920, partial [Ferruginibacter sp.]|nr:hypothetical protein [Ferruginibacter sp.]
MPALVPKAEKLFRNCCFVVVTFFVVGTVSCQSAQPKKNVATQDSTGAYILPDPSPITGADSVRLHNAVAHWYDTALNANTYNGGMIVAYKGNIVFENYHGTIHRPGKDTITANTPMQVASTS